jgi:hypothetical protein
MMTTATAPMRRDHVIARSNLGGVPSRPEVLPTATSDEYGPTRRRVADANAAGMGRIERASEGAPRGILSLGDRAG